MTTVAHQAYHYLHNSSSSTSSILAPCQHCSLSFMVCLLSLQTPLQCLQGITSRCSSQLAYNLHRCLVVCCLLLFSSCLVCHHPLFSLRCHHLHIICQACRPSSSSNSYQICLH